MNLRPSTATVAAAVLSLGLGFAAGSVPNNSVGSPQLKDGQVKSVDISNGGVTSTDVKNGSLTEADLAAGTLPGQATLAGTKNSLGGCSASGWCMLSSNGTGTTVGSFDTPPPNSNGWTSTGTIELPQASSVLLTATPTLWFFGTSNLDATCSIKDGTTALLSSGWVRSDGNESRTVSINGLVSLAAGTHAITLNCRAGGVDVAAATSVSMSAMIVPNP